MAIELSRENINAARIILDHPIVIEVLDGMETDALNNAVNAKLTDTDTVAAFLAEVRAIRKFRASLLQTVQMGEDALKRNKAAK